MTVAWGNVPEWVGALLTGGGVLVAAYQLRLGRVAQERARAEARESEQQRRLAEARSVGIKVIWGKTDTEAGTTPITVRASNGAPYPLSGVVIEIVTDNPYPREQIVGTLLPGEQVQETYEVPRAEVVFGELTGGADLLFTDAYGTHWRRSPHGELSQEAEAPRMC